MASPEDRSYSSKDEIPTYGGTTQCLCLTVLSAFHACPFPLYYHVSFAPSPDRFDEGNEMLNSSMWLVQLSCEYVVLPTRTLKVVLADNKTEDSQACYFEMQSRLSLLIKVLAARVILSFGSTAIDPRVSSFT